MEAITTHCVISKNHRLKIDVPVSAGIPSGKIEAIVVLFPDRLPSKKSSSIMGFCGCLKGSKTFKGDSVAIQRKLRDEWE